MQPIQQHGLRIPPLSFESVFSIRIPRVSAFFPEITQQIHSLRARGVISSHTARARGEAVRAFRKSSGSLCTVPVEGYALTIRPCYQSFYELGFKYFTFVHTNDKRNNKRQRVV